MLIIDRGASLEQKCLRGRTVERERGSEGRLKRCFEVRERAKMISDWFHTVSSSAVWNGARYSWRSISMDIQGDKAVSFLALELEAIA